MSRFIWKRPAYGLCAAAALMTACAASPQAETPTVTPTEQEPEPVSPATPALAPFAASGNASMDAWRADFAARAVASGRDAELVVRRSGPGPDGRLPARCRGAASCMVASTKAWRTLSGVPCGNTTCSKRSRLFMSPCDAVQNQHQTPSCRQYGLSSTLSIILLHKLLVLRGSRQTYRIRLESSHHGSNLSVDVFVVASLRFMDCCA